MCPARHQLPVEVGGRFLEQVPRALVFRRREEAHVPGAKAQDQRGQLKEGRAPRMPPAPRLPVQALVVVLPIEELYLLERVGTRQIATYRRMNGEEGVQRGGASFLGADYQEPRQLVAGFVPRPDLLMPLVVAGILRDPNER